jgi:type II secretory pathway pseudopilin PulG
MVALLVAMTVMAIMMTAAMPAWHTLARREKEAELVFRGEQYARALMLYQRRFANQPAPSIDALVTGRYLRKKYKDPITNDDFQLLGGGATMPGQAGDALGALQGARGGAAAGRGGAAPAARGGAVPATAQAGRGGVSLGGGVTGGIVGVTSKSEEKSLRLYNGRDTYNQWVFMPVAQAARAGGVGPGGAGRGGVEGGRGRGGPEGAAGRGGIDAGRGRGPQPPGDGGRGRGPQPPGDAGRGGRGRGF